MSYSSLINTLKFRQKILIKKNIEQDVNYDNFEYIVSRKEQDKICFGSSTPRKLKYFVYNPAGTCGPTTYNLKFPQKPRSKKGLPGLANTSVRGTVQTSITPSPARYNVIPKRQNIQSCAPFNSTVPLLYKNIKEGPGPTVYNAHKVKNCKRTKFSYNFGQPCLLPAVEYKCINYPTEKCEKCGTPFEYGDHWHKNYTIYLCTFCMDEEHRLHELYSERELLNFKKIRTCTFMHRHEGTSAKVRLMSQKEVDKKIRLENYLSLYFQCYGTKSKTELVVPYNDVM